MLEHVKVEEKKEGKRQKEKKKKEKTNANIYLVYLERRGNASARTENLRNILSLKIKQLSFKKFLSF